MEELTPQKEYYILKYELAIPSSERKDLIKYLSSVHPEVEEKKLKKLIPVYLKELGVKTLKNEKSYTIVFESADKRLKEATIEKINKLLEYASYGSHIEVAINLKDSFITRCTTVSIKNVFDEDDNMAFTRELVETRNYEEFNECYNLRDIQENFYALDSLDNIFYYNGGPKELYAALKNISIPDIWDLIVAMK
jgi:hypothetical protein